MIKEPLAVTNFCAKEGRVCYSLVQVGRFEMKLRAGVEKGPQGKPLLRTYPGQPT